jgi:hypothetical protein
MKTGNTSALEFVSCKNSRRYRAVVGVVAVMTIAFAPNVGALAQGTHAARNTREFDAQRQSSLARLIVPVTGTVETATPTPPAEPPTTPTEPPATPTEPPSTPTEPPTTPTAPPTTPTTTGQTVAAPDVTGSFAIRRFARTTDDAVAAVGTLTISLTDPASNAVRTIVTELAVPIARSEDSAAPSVPDAPTQPIGSTSRALASADASPCGTLSLVLGPLQLDVLGNVVQLNESNVDVIAVPGAGERLKNRLCGVTALMDAAATSAEVVRMLNRLLDTLG